MIFWLLNLLLADSHWSLSDESMKPSTSLTEFYRSQFSSELQRMLDLSLYNRCMSSTGSPGITCEGFLLGDSCLRDFLWCRDDFKVNCARGLASNNDVFCGNRRYWERHRCHISDREGEHKGVRCHGTQSGQCIFPIYAGYLPVLRTCADHSNEVFDDTYICYGGSMRYSRAEYPHCRTDCEQRSSTRCHSCMDTNLCTHSCLNPGPSCLACTNPQYFKCGGSCLHPELVCDGHLQCRHGEDEAWERCQGAYRARGVDWRRYIWNIINAQHVWSRNGTFLN